MSSRHTHTRTRTLPIMTLYFLSMCWKNKDKNVLCMLSSSVAQQYMLLFLVSLFVFALAAYFFSRAFVFLLAALLFFSPEFLLHFLHNEKICLKSWIFLTSSLQHRLQRATDAGGKQQPVLCLLPCVFVCLSASLCGGGSEK